MLLVVSLALPVLLIGWGISEVCDDDDGSDGLSVEGGEGDDFIEGSQRADLLQGNEGDDLIRGRSGNDTVFGQEGEDILEGEDGDDMLCSGEGDDIVTGNRGFDFIEGQEGNDFISGDYNGDIARGDEGEDTVIGGRGGDRVAGGQGSDVLFGGIMNELPLNRDEMEELRDGASLSDILAGEDGRINIRDDRFSDALFGGAGADQLFVGSMDNATGGNGEDTFNVLADQQDNGPATIHDFAAEDDNVTIIVNGDTDIEITVEADGEDALVMSDGQVLARVTGAAQTLTAADIAILTEASVVGMFDPNA